MIADIPGLIEGAHEGAGIGDRFLGHIERCATLLHLVDGTQEDVAGAYRTVRGELEAYGAGLAEKPEIVALNKIDAISEDELPDKIAVLKEASGKDVLALSGASQANVREALFAVWEQIKAARQDELEETAEPEESWTP